MIAPAGRDRIRFLALLALAAMAAWLPPVVLRFALPALSPFVFLATLLATRDAGWASLCALPVLILVLWRRRGFCRCGCPVGWLADTLGKIGRKRAHSYVHIPSFGRWAALLTFGGAIVSCPLFLVFDPLALFASAAGAARPPFSPSDLACAAGLAAIVAASLAFPSLWCVRLCPLGGTQDLIADVAGLLVRRSVRTSSASATGTIARRAFVGLGAGIGAATLGLGWARRGDAAGPLRPPGAAEDAIFKTLCLRCGNCVRSCPTAILRPDLSPSDVAGLLAPTVRFDEGHCLDTCNRCGQHCPTGAIAPLALERKNASRIGLAQIDTAACLLSIEKECGACLLVCKRQAILDDFSPKTYSVTLRIDENRCNGCGACVPICPPRAIVVRGKSRCHG